MPPTTTTDNYGTAGATSPAKDTFVANAAARGYSGPSVVDYLNLNGSPSDFNSRAKMSGVPDYTGTAEQNTTLLTRLRGGSTTVDPTTGASVPAPTAPQAPTATTGNSIEDAYKSAFDTYLKSLQPSPEQTQARDYLNKLISQNASDNDKALNSGETLGYARALAAKVNNSERNDISAASRALTALNGEQSTQTTIAKDKADYLKGLYDTQAKNKAATTKSTQFNLSPGQTRYQYNEKTGKYESIASVPAKPTKAATGPRPTVSDQTALAFSKIDSLTKPGVKDANGVPYLAPDGTLTYDGFKTLVRAAAGSKVNRTAFLKQYGAQLQPGVNGDYSGYGLTGAEIRALKGPRATTAATPPL